MKRLLFPNLLKSEIEKRVSSLVQIKPVGSFILFYSHDGFSALELGHNSNCFPPIGALEIIRKVDFIRIYIKVIQVQSTKSFIQALLYRIMYLFPNLNDIFSHNPITFTHC